MTPLTYSSLTSTKVIQLLILLNSITRIQMFEPGCSRPLGLMTGAIEDWQLSSSSVKSDDPSCLTKYARLYQPGNLAWCPQTRRPGSDTHHWILIDFGVSTAVSGLLLQGRGDDPEWVTLFTLAFSMDAYKWEWIQDIYGRKMMFRGNINSYQIQTVWLDSAVTTRFLRLHILEWETHPSLRLEILGCQDCASIISGPGIGSGLTASSFGTWIRKNSCQPQDAHIHSSHAWCSKHNNGEQWLQLDLGPPTMITGILTRGRGDAGRRQWVTSYMISYSNDSTLWYFYKETNHLSGKIFGGNMDKGTERRHYFNSQFVARFVRLHPVSWHNSISLRVALLGCPTAECPPNFFRLNSLTPCCKEMNIPEENLAWKKEIWTNDKKHFWKDWKFGHASLAVDGSLGRLLPECAILDNYYTDSPVWMVDLGRRRDLTGVIIVTWQGEGQDKGNSYREYTLNIERLSVYVSNKPRQEGTELSTESKCGSISRGGGAIFQPRLRFDCGHDHMTGRYIYVQAIPVTNRFDRIFNFVLCEVIVYRV